MRRNGGAVPDAESLNREWLDALFASFGRETPELDTLVTRMTERRRFLRDTLTPSRLLREGDTRRSLGRRLGDYVGNAAFRR